MTNIAEELFRCSREHLIERGPNQSDLVPWLLGKAETVLMIGITGPHLEPQSPVTTKILLPQIESLGDKIESFYFQGTVISCPFSEVIKPGMPVSGWYRFNVKVREKGWILFAEQWTKEEESD